MLLRMLDLKVANHDDRGLREQLQAREQNLTALQGRVGLLERDLLSTQAHADNLQRSLEAQRAQTQAALAERDQALAQRDQFYGEFERKNQHILYLERLLQGIEAGRVFQVTRRASRLLGRK